MRGIEEHENWSITHRHHVNAAAMPLLIFGMCVAAITLFVLVVGGPSQIEKVLARPQWHILAIVVAMLVLVVLITAAVFATKGRLPCWSYTWIGSCMAGMLIALNLVIEDRDFVISPSIDITFLALFLLSGLITYGVAALRGWVHTGLFTIGFMGPLGLSLCFFGIAGPFYPNLGLLAVLLGGIESLLVYVYIRHSKIARLATLFCVGIINAGVAWIVEWLFRQSNPGREIGQFWSLLVLLTLLMVGGTLLGLPGKVIGQRYILRSTP